MLINYNNKLLGPQNKHTLYSFSVNALIWYGCFEEIQTIYKIVEVNAWGEVEPIEKKKNTQSIESY